MTGVAFSPDGRRILTGSKDGTAKVWDADKGQAFFSLKAHKFAVRSVAFSPDGRRILTGSGEYGKPGEARVWDADMDQELFPLTGGTDGVRAWRRAPTVDASLPAAWTRP